MELHKESSKVKSSNLLDRAIAFSFGGNNQRLNLRLLRLNTSCPAKIEGG